MELPVNKEITAVIGAKRIKGTLQYGLNLFNELELSVIYNDEGITRTHSFLRLSPRLPQPEIDMTLQFYVRAFEIKETTHAVR